MLLRQPFAVVRCTMLPWQPFAVVRCTYTHQKYQLLVFKVLCGFVV